VSSYIGAVYHRDAANRVDTGKIKGIEYELVRTGLRLLASAQVGKKQKKDLREYVSAYQIITATQLILLGQRLKAIKLLIQCKTKKYISSKIWWLFWAMIPTSITLWAKRMRRAMVAILSRKITANVTMQNIIKLNVDKYHSFLYRYFKIKNTAFWNDKANNIDKNWGMSDGDFKVLEKIICSQKANKILDVGCGSGRLFPLYSKLGVSEVVGQDISVKALEIARERYDYKIIKTTSKGICDLIYPKGYFDLIISNRTLQHIPSRDIARVIKKLISLGKNIYINEMSDSDYSPGVFYMVKHDYKSIFEKNNYRITQSGFLNKQTWILFGERK
jgi:2-polyprenyl-3-methyl-5-hydroxy-6-metoxy-1,4-benzoquinol methylase